ncbi:hypothetical protein [Allorhodopirellula heiligendammensis]|uniref:LTXXQ motif protein n=1 Tax=Allorhodopirellula heiligendammensis TaxID=2714739 RepID=A0A5C6C1K6_9BACT|nr:hypothetical protein [Allorhodopirellula heiligendammensis]TWU18453.1 hypothetical protein Poly21_06160 [Allorhodopirellula heiligendammensis]|tara:strand:- start:302 stop:817 length:516 start_codon:yes stop_codon:yes gene_type:complete
MRNLFALALIAALSVTTVADEAAPKKNKGNRAGRNQAVAKLTKGLESAGLSAEQQTKIKAATVAFTAKVKELREDGLTPELMKKRTEAMKAAREAGLKGKDIRAKVNESLTAEEIATFEKMTKATAELHKAVVSTLSKEQLEALPEAVRKSLQAGAKQGQGRQGKGKKDAA